MKSEIDESRLIDTPDRSVWRAWLAAHYHSEREAWLVSYKKHTGKPSISYNDAVEEALCFGWIDSIIRRLDDDRVAQRYTPRNPKSPYSQPNKERLRVLIRQGMVVDSVLATLGNLDAEQFDIPLDILAAIQANDDAWRNFQNFSPPYIRIRIAFIEAARNRPREFEKRLKHFLQMTERNKQFGYGGIEKYF